MIPPLNIRTANVELQEELQQAFARFIESGKYVLGPETEGFESEYAAYCQTQNCVGVSSGLDALHLALRAIGVQHGDEIIVASNTYIATWLAVTHAGAKVIPVEPDPATHNIDPSKIEEKVTEKTRAVLATNLYGQPIDYDRIRQVTDAEQLWFVTDNAQGAGAKYKNRPVGGIADLECHSFYPTKNLGALGEAGAVTTAKNDIAERIRMLRNYGSKHRYEHHIAGFNNRIDELQAAILRVKLRHLDEWNRQRKIVADTYSEALDDCPHVITPNQPEWADSVWHQYVVRVSQRNQVQKQLTSASIGSLVHYPTPPHQSLAYAQDGFKARDFPIANSLAESVLSLPMGPHIPLDEVHTVANTLADIANEHASEWRPAA